MINQENINKIYNAVISDKTLTTKELASYGFTSTDLRKLKEQGILESIKRGEYQLASLDHLYNHGINELSLGNPHIAMLYFNKCIDLDPNHLPSYFQILLFHIKQNNYQKIYRILDKLNEVPSCKPEIRNLYLYLLSFITKLPIKYQEEVLSLAEVANSTNREFETEEDKIIRKIYEGKFLPAMHNLKILLAENPDKIELVITKMLLSQTIIAEKKLSKELLELAKKERYNDIQIILETKTKINNNKLSDQYALLLSKMIQQILRTSLVPEVLPSDPNLSDMFDAINKNNFALALKLNKEYLAKYNLDSNNLLSILLQKINDLIFQIKNKENNNESKPASLSQKQVVKSESITKPRISKNIQFAALLSELFQQHIEKFFDLLKLYLKQIGKESYQYLIIKLTKLSILESDNSFLKPILILTELEKNTYNFDVSSYIQEFYLNISQNKLPQAKIYLEIISKYYQGTPDIIPHLTNILSSSTSNENKSLPKAENLNKPASSLQDKMLDKSPTIEEERALILKIYAEMKKNGEVITILKDIPWERRKKIHLVVKEIPELLSFSAGSESKIIVLRHINPRQERIVFKEKLDVVFNQYEIKQYQLSIDAGLQLLQDSHFNPIKYKEPMRLFRKIGMAYLKLNNREEAIKYLTIATSLNQEQPMPKQSYDHTELISKLQSSSYQSTDNDFQELEIPEVTEVFEESSSYQAVTIAEETVFEDESVVSETSSLDDQQPKANLHQNIKEPLQTVQEKSIELQEPIKEVPVVNEKTEKLIPEVPVANSNDKKVIIETSQTTEIILPKTETSKATREVLSEYSSLTNASTKQVSIKQENIPATSNESSEEPVLDIQKIEEIAYYLSSTKTSLANAITEFSLNESQVQLIKLVYARDYYIEGIMTEGDKLLKQVEKTRNKTKQVRDFLNEIKRDRLFYKSRPELKNKKRSIILHHH